MTICQFQPLILEDIYYCTVHLLLELNSGGKNKNNNTVNQDILGNKLRYILCIYVNVLRMNCQTISALHQEELMSKKKKNPTSEVYVSQ